MFRRRCAVAKQACLTVPPPLFPLSPPINVNTVTIGSVSNGKSASVQE